MQKKRMNESQEILARVRALLGDETTLSLATTGDDGQPCVAPLFYIADASFSLYWISSASSQHSRNLLQRSHAAATVYCAAESWRQIRGVQIRGTVSVVTEPERRAAITKIYCKRFNLGRILKLAVRQSVLHVLQPEFLRYLDNSRGFKSNFELALTPQGWASARSTN